MLPIKEYENYMADFIKEVSFSPIEELILGETVGIQWKYSFIL